MTDKPDERKWVHTTRLPILWGHMDAMGHVNNCQYFRYFEQARVDWLASRAFEANVTQGEGPVIAKTACVFKRPLTYPGWVEVKVYVGPAGRSSLPTYYEILRVDTNEVAAEGEALLVWISTATGKSVPLPDVLKA